MKNNNYLWQKFYGENEYNIQTIDKKIHAKLSRRKKFKLILHGINKKIWVYKVRFKSPKIARKSFERIVGSKCKKTNDKRLFVAQSGSTGVVKINN